MPRQYQAPLLAYLTASVAWMACSSEDSTALDVPPIISSHDAALRDMTEDEAREDLEQIFSYVENLYGAYEYKEALFSYSFPELEDTARAMLAESPGDDGFYTTANAFLASFNDGHVWLDAGASSNPVTEYVIALDLQSVQGKALIFGFPDASLTDLGIAYGDEVISVDGHTPGALLDEVLKYGTLANPVSNQQLIYQVFFRPGFAASLRPEGPTAHVSFRRADGSQYSRDLVWWQELQNPLGPVAAPDPVTVIRDDSFLAHLRGQSDPTAPEASLLFAGQAQPFFVNPTTTEAFDITPITPSPASLEAVRIDPEAALPDIFAATYSHAGKKLLLIRQATYDANRIPPRLALSYYRAILNEYEGQVDGLVVDQTHNLGGSIAYCFDFFRLFSANPARNLVEAFNTDRRWIDGFRAVASQGDPTLTSEIARNYLLRSSLVEAAYDRGDTLTEPMPLLDDTFLAPTDYVWKKPLLVLIDELSASAGDMFPMLIQANHVAPLFGQRSMGLGGNVEPVSILPHSDAQLHLSRGLVAAQRADGVYSPTDFIENRGVKPDIAHEITVDDFRAGFVDYMRHFSDQIVSQLHPPE